jgi:hypothetical protein
MANADKISLQIGNPSRASGGTPVATGFRACPSNRGSRPGGPIEWSPGREAGVWKAQVVQPRRVRVGLLESYAPPALYFFAYGYPGLTAGATLYRPSGPCFIRLLGQALQPVAKQLSPLTRLSAHLMQTVGSS